nr:sulfite exporter TauE/SafE family protein [Methanobrevibacter arboriphilus]
MLSHLFRGVIILLIEYIFFLIIIGIFAGSLAGLLGIGGGFLMVPLQYFLLTSMGVDHDLALRISIGTSLAIIIPTAISGAYSHQCELKNILNIGIILGILGMFGGILGGIASSNLPSNILGSILGFFLIFTSIFMVLNKKISKKDSETDSEISIKKNIKKDIESNSENNIEYTCKDDSEKDCENNIEINSKLNFNVINNDSNEIDNDIERDGLYSKLKWSILFGIIVGFLSGLLGIGGGIFLIPLLILLGFTLRRSIAISSVFISLTAIGGTLSYIFTGFGVNTLPYSLGYISLVNFGIIILFSIPMAYFGAKLAYKIPEKRLNQIFAILLFYMGIKMLGLDPISYILGI